MDVALTIEYLVPGAAYFGSTSCDSEACLTNMTWTDERTKPTWQEIVDNADAAELDYLRKNLECTPLQIRRALRVTGDYDVVTGMMAQADAATQEAWEHAITIYRLDPIVESLLTALERSPTEADQLFILANTF